jgi:hypothetical protein
MLKSIWNYIVATEKHAVDVILSDFHSVVGRLHAAAEVHFEVAADAAVEAARLNEVEAAALAEAERAKAIAMNISALVTLKGI